MSQAEITARAAPLLTALPIPAALFAGAAGKFEPLHVNAAFAALFPAGSWRAALEALGAAGPGPARAAGALRRALLADAPAEAMAPLRAGEEHLILQAPVIGGHGSSAAVLVAAAPLAEKDRLAALRPRLEALLRMGGTLNEALAAARLPQVSLAAIEGFDASSLAFARLRSLP